MIDRTRLGRAVLTGVLVVAASTAVAAPARAAATSRPTVTGVSAAAGPLAGGNRVTVRGSGFRTGVRVWFGLRAGTRVHVSSSHRLTVVAPAHPAGRIHVRVARGGSTSSRTPADRYRFTGSPSQLHWGPARTGDPYRGGLDDVSCPSKTFCLALGEDGRYLTYDGSSWSAPKAMRGYDATSVSCPTARTCTAVTSRGYVTTWTAGSWSAPHRVGNRHWDHVSCPTAGFCMVLDATRVTRPVTAVRGRHPRPCRTWTPQRSTARRPPRACSWTGTAPR
jgi:hypothetical protein